MGLAFPIETPENARVRAANALALIQRERANATDPEQIAALDREIAANRARAAGAQPGAVTPDPTPAAPGIRIVVFEGKSYQFPADATDDEVAAALGQMAPAPQAPQASQADVRKAEKPMSPMQDQQANERTFDAQLQAWLQTPAGRPYANYPYNGETARKAFSKATGQPDPLLNRDQTNIEEMRQGGDVTYGQSLPYQAAKIGANVAGFVKGGPAGATAAEAAVRLAALATNLKQALDAGAITEDRAAELLAQHMAAGTTEDALFNFGVPLLGKIVAKIPGMNAVAEKAAKIISAKFGKMIATPATDEAAQRARAVQRLVGKASTPAAKEAVQQITTRMEPSGMVPAPGQVTGNISAPEVVARIGNPKAFAAQEAETSNAVGGMRNELVSPQNQPTRQEIGQQVADIAEKTQAAVKNRLRPTFDAADNLGVRVNMQPVLDEAKKALAYYQRVPGGSPQESAYLESIIHNLENEQPTTMSGAPMMTAQDALDFVSNLKAKLRSTTADWKPSSYFGKVIGNLTGAVDDAYAQAAQSAGKADVAKNLLDAQGQYRDMMGTVYEDAVKQALRKNPEDVGKLFWQAGNVSEPQQLQKLLQLAQREGVTTARGAQNLSSAMARGFLQEAVPDIASAAKWSETLNAKPGLRDTWNTLTSAPGGQELRHGMEVLEQAAQIAQRQNPELISGAHAMPLRRAANFGVGVSYVTGIIHPGMAVAGLAVDQLARMMATAYTQGNKGVINLISRVLRANSVGTAAAAQIVQAALPQLEQYAKQTGIDPFVPQQQQ